MERATLLATVEEIDDAAVSAVHGAAGSFAGDSWTLGPPVLVDEIDASSCTRPEDEPIRSLGFVLFVTAAGVPGGTPKHEVGRFVAHLCDLSRTAGLSFELQLERTYVGSIAAGVADRFMTRGLIESW
jgi:hypothetical protein